MLIHIETSFFETSFAGGRFSILELDFRGFIMYA